MSITERPPELASSAFSNPPYWLLVGGEADFGSTRPVTNSRVLTPEILSLDLAGGRVLPVFSSEDSAAEFLSAWLAASAADMDPDEASARVMADNTQRQWRLRGTGSGELISLLSGSAFSAGPCARVERVALDPPLALVHDLTRGVAELQAAETAGMSRRCFLERLMGRGRSWFESRDEAGARVEEE